MVSFSTSTLAMYNYMKAKYCNLFIDEQSSRIRTTFWYSLNIESNTLDILHNLLVSQQDLPTNKS